MKAQHCSVREGVNVGAYGMKLVWCLGILDLNDNVSTILSLTMVAFQFGVMNRVKNFLKEFKNILKMY